MLKVRSSKGGKPVDVDIVEFVEDDGHNYFLLKSTIEPDVQIVVNYVLPVDTTYDCRNFECVPFMSASRYKENDIFELHVQDNTSSRVGWIFPVQAVISNEHSFSKNEHFVKYAFVICQKLLRGECFPFPLVIDVDSFDEEISVDKLYPSSLIIVALSNATTKVYPEFDIKNYLPYFYLNGYYFCNDLRELASLQYSQTVSAKG